MTHAIRMASMRDEEAVEFSRAALVLMAQEKFPSCTKPHHKLYKGMDVFKEQYVCFKCRHCDLHSHVYADGRVTV
mgnify:CR=1 FL=1